MKHMNFRQIKEHRISGEGILNVTMRLAVSKKDGAPTFTMRLFHIGPGGHTPSHQHPWEHEVYIIEGEGQLITEDSEHRAIHAGDFIYIDPSLTHQFQNTGTTQLSFICVVPHEGQPEIAD